MPERKPRGINTPDTMGLTIRVRAMRRIAAAKPELLVVETFEEFAAQAARERIQRLIERLKATCPDANE